MSLKEREQRKDKKYGPHSPPAQKKGANLQARSLAIGQWLVRWYGIPLSRTGT